MGKIFVLLVGLSFVSLTLSEMDNQISDSVYVDFLTNNYLLTQKDIWNDIASNANLKDVTQKIHSVHLNLFSNSFLSSQQSYDPLLINGKNFFDANVAELNLKIRVAKEKYLRDSTDPAALKKEILDMATNNSNTTLINSIYDSVIREDFFGYIKMVIKIIFVYRLYNLKKYCDSFHNFSLEFLDILENSYIHLIHFNFEI